MSREIWVIFQRFSLALFLEKIDHFWEKWRSRSSVVQFFAIETKKGRPKLLAKVFCEFRERELNFEEGWQSRSRGGPGGVRRRAAAEPDETHQRYHPL